MINPRKQIFFKVLIGLIIASFFSLHVSSYVLQNGSGTGYCDETKTNCDEGEAGSSDLVYTKSSYSAINIYIEEGAAYYLNAYSDFLEFLGRYELSNQNGLNFEECKKNLAGAIYYIKNAEDTYNLLVAATESTPYNQDMIYKLKIFDYDSFGEKYSLNSIVLNDVANYLKFGDIRGIHKRIYFDVIGLSNMLKIIYNDVAANKMPDLSTVWQTNERFSNILIFGQYVARVFFELIDKI